MTGTRGAITVQARFAYPATLVAVWVAMVVAVNPIGDFPLNDDWAWGLAVKTLYEQHVLTIPAFAGMSLVAHILWGFVACLPAGFSFTALRLSSAVLGLAAVLSTYGLCLEAGATRGLAFLCALAVAANPLIFEHALSFMTDTPFLALVLLSMLCFVHSVRSGARVTAALAIVLALAATLTRQTGVVLPALFAGACVLGRTVTVRIVGVLLLAAVVVHGGLGWYEEWLRASGQMGPSYDIYARELRALLRNPAALANRPLTIGDGLRMVLTYVGFFLLPVLVAILPRRLRANKAFVLLGVALAGWFAWSTTTEFARRGWRMPFNQNFCLVDLGLGPMTLTDVRVRNLPHLPGAGIAFWQWVTRLGIVGGGLVIVLVVVTGLELFTRRVVTTGKSATVTTAAALGFAGAYGTVVLLTPYDRYFIPLFPMLLIAGAWGAGALRWTWISRPLFALAFVGILLQAGFSVAATHDYLAWNRVRWAALRDLMRVHGVPPRQIDGGVEFNGTYLYGTRSPPGKSPFWVEDDLYMVTFGPMPGYRTFSEHPFARWLPPGQGTVFILVREPTP